MAVKNKSVSTNALNALNKLIRQTTNGELAVATSLEQQSKVNIFIQKSYAKHYSELANTNKSKSSIPQEKENNGLLLYASNESGKIIAAARISTCIDDSVPCQERIFEALCDEEVDPNSVIYVGSWVNSGESNLSSGTNSLKAYILVARFFKVKGIIGWVKKKNKRLHKIRIGAQLIQEDTELTFGSRHRFSLAMWQLDKLSDHFYRKIGLPSQTTYLDNASQPPNNEELQTLTLGDRYGQKIWNNYAQAFYAIQTNAQSELQKEAAAHLSGRVVDLGCGSAKMFPWLHDKQSVAEYVGVDACPDMLKFAQLTLSHFTEFLDKTQCQVIHSRIEDMPMINAGFDSAVSLNSYYAWQQPEIVLQHIFHMLAPQGILVLASPNPTLTADKLNILDAEEQRVLFSHPHYPEFVRQNIELVSSPHANFVTLDVLLQQVQVAGFSIRECKQTFYGGGMNFVVASKNC